MKSIYVFQNDLRIENNNLLLQSIEESKEIHFAIIKPIDFETKDDLGFFMWSGPKKKFYFQALADLSSDLDQRGFSFLVFDSVIEFKKHLQDFKFERVYVSSSPLNYENRILKSIPKNIEVISNSNDLLIDYKNFFFEPKMSFTKFRKSIEKLKFPIQKLSKSSFKSSVDIDEKLHKSNTVSEWCQTNLKTLDSHAIAFSMEGSRRFALNHLEDYIWKSQHIKNYKKTRNGMIKKSDSSKFSLWLAYGVLSPIEIFNEINSYEVKFGANSSTYWFKLELLWREYFKLISISYRDSIFKSCGLSESYIEPKISNISFVDFNNWKSGSTKNSFINANMIELYTTGYMSNRGRQNVASYLAHELGLPWLWGAKWFESQLIDHDPALNYGNWQYVSGAGIWGVHKFDYEWQSQMYDPDKEYEKFWLAKFDQKMK